MVYISHGGGPWPIMGDARHVNLIEFLQELPSSLISPAAILLISAHWEERVPTIQSGARPELYFDYYGFPEETYRYTYPAPGAPELAGKLFTLLADAGFTPALDGKRGFDHGMFVPLMLMYPEAAIPCLQLSLCNSLEPRRHIDVGRAIAGLRDENILIIGSGSTFHNLPAFREPPTRATKKLNAGFESWLRDTLTSDRISEDQRRERLTAWDLAVGARYCQPREEHLLPLHLCYGIAGAPADRVIEVEYMDRTTSMYIWADPHL
ncbi:MAG: DODA-type extradiol aromatic ring-opening family dioxygenase [Desulfopila sp.]